MGLGASQLRTYCLQLKNAGVICSRFEQGSAVMMAILSVNDESNAHTLY